MAKFCPIWSLCVLSTHPSEAGDVSDGLGLGHLLAVEQVRVRLPKVGKARVTQSVA
jgi:hypothetical protein